MTKFIAPRILVATLLAIIFVCGGLFYVISQTPQGLRFATNFFVDHFLNARTMTIGSVQGTLASTVIYKDVELKDLDRLPAGTVVRIQELVITPHGMNYKNVEIKIHNARLKFPTSENIVVDGTFKDQSLNLTVFSPLIDLTDILSLRQNNSGPLKSLQGNIRQLEIQIAGTLMEVSLSGKFVIEELSRPDLALSQSPGTLDLTLFDFNKDLKIKGEVAIEKGFVQARRTKIELKPSKIYFSGNAQDPALLIEGFSRIDALEIDILVKGTAQKPDLKLTSDPPLSSEELMVTMATGKKWQGLTNLEEGRVSPILAREFIGYLFFSDSGESFLDHMGITDVKLTFEGDSKGLGFKKEVSDHMDVGYEIEQKGLPSGQQDISQTIGADYRLTNEFFASIERQLQVVDGQKASAPDAVDSRLLMKYKTKF